jgi:hypothetical protein
VAEARNGAGQRNHSVVHRDADVAGGSVRGVTHHDDLALDGLVQREVAEGRLADEKDGELLAEHSVALVTGGAHPEEIDAAL